MKLYQGFMPKGNDAGPRLVYVKDSTGRTEPLEHHARHSPTGFSWGYTGSGPAELAMCILWDFLGQEPHPMLYQKFKDDYVAGWGHDDWVLSSAAIEAWLDLNKSIPRQLHKSGTTSVAS